MRCLCVCKESQIFIKGSSLVRGSLLTSCIHLFNRGGHCLRCWDIIVVVFLLDSNSVGFESTRRHASRWICEGISRKDYLREKDHSHKSDSNWQWWSRGLRGKWWFFSLAHSLSVLARAHTLFLLLTSWCQSLPSWIKDQQLSRDPLGFQWQIGTCHPLIGIHPSGLRKSQALSFSSVPIAMVGQLSPYQVGQCGKSSL